jgi:hypothetical protein
VKAGQEPTVRVCRAGVLVGGDTGQSASATAGPPVPVSVRTRRNGRAGAAGVGG